MNKKLIIYTYIFMIFILSALYVDKNRRDVEISAHAGAVSTSKVSTYAEASFDKELAMDVQLQKQEVYKRPSEVKLSEARSTEVKSATLKASVKAIAVAAKNPTLSRGGSISTAAASNNERKKLLSKVETLDWWKAGRNAFPIGSVAEVKDVYTGKTFKIKRTMGTNHADCEAVSKADTEIIKSIWGGFSWETRPVILTVGGRRLAASMSSMPHAGVDSAPFGAVVNNRSEGYGRGENLDAVKGNGMNGHFDVHFLNSTRHKDGKEDPRHQASIAVAARR